MQAKILLVAEALEASKRLQRDSPTFRVLLRKGTPKTNKKNLPHPGPEFLTWQAQIFLNT